MELTRRNALASQMRRCCWQSPRAGGNPAGSAIHSITTSPITAVDRLYESFWNRDTFALE